MECGAGTAIPTVRRFCEEVADHPERKLIRINLREPEVPDGHIGLATGALAGLRAIDELLDEALRAPRSKISLSEILEKERR